MDRFKREYCLEIESELKKKEDKNMSGKIQSIELALAKGSKHLTKKKESGV